MENLEITVNKYNIYKENGTYILDFGNVKAAEDKTVSLLIKGIEDSTKLKVLRTCSCTIAHEEIVDKNTQIVRLTYDQCAPTIAKVLEVRYNNKKIGIIKIKGKCK